MRKVIADNNIHLFKKINRKYTKRNSVKHVDIVGGKRFTSYWFENDWLFFQIDDKNQLQNMEVQEEIEKRTGDYTLNWLIDNADQLFPLMGKEITFRHTWNVKGITVTAKFMSLVMTNRDVYYYVYNKEDNSYRLLTMIYEPIDLKK